MDYLFFLLQKKTVVGKTTSLTLFLWQLIIRSIFCKYELQWKEWKSWNTWLEPRRAEGGSQYNRKVPNSVPYRLSDWRYALIGGSLSCLPEYTVLRGKVYNYENKLLTFNNKVSEYSRWHISVVCCCRMHTDSLSPLRPV